MKNSNIIEKYLDEIIPNPKCELNYSKDYELLIAIVLSAQTTDKGVNKVTSVLFDKYPSLEELNKADISDIVEIIKPIGTFNRKSYYVKEIARILVEKYNGLVPNDRNILESLPGVGRKVCNVFLSEWYKIPNIAVDTHVERVSKRLNLVSNNASVLEVENTLKKVIDKDNWCKIHLQLVLFGRYTCKSKNPECSNCKLKDICNYKKKI